MDAFIAIGIAALWPFLIAPAAILKWTPPTNSELRRRSEELEARVKKLENELGLVEDVMNMVQEVGRLRRRCLSYTEISRELQIERVFVRTICRSMGWIVPPVLPRRRPQ